jgi:hypothetical protein
MTTAAVMKSLQRVPSRQTTSDIRHPVPDVGDADRSRSYAGIMGYEPLHNCAGGLSASVLEWRERGDRILQVAHVGVLDANGRRHPRVGRWVYFMAFVESHTARIYVYM